MDDVRAAQARQHHRAAGEVDSSAARHRYVRNQLIRALRADNPQRWSYTALARAVGCTPELVAAIVKHRVP